MSLSVSKKQTPNQAKAAPAARPKPQAKTTGNSVFSASGRPAASKPQVKPEMKTAPQAQSKIEEKKQPKAKKQDKKKKTEAEKKDLNNLSLNQLKQKLKTASKELKSAIKNAITQKEGKDGNFKNGKGDDKNAQNKQKNCANGQCGQGSGGGNVCQSKGGGAGGAKGSKGGGATDGKESEGDETLKKAHEEAASDCEKLGQQEEKPQGSTKGVTTWKKLAKYIKSNATKAKWKDFSGGVLGTCSSSGKTCYSSKLKNNVSKLKEVIVHENVHDIEFKETGNSDEKDTYNIHKEYSKKIGNKGGGGGKGG